MSSLPPIAGREQELSTIVKHNQPVFINHTNPNLAEVKAGFACALHMHQPPVPAGHNGQLISNLEHMFHNQGIGDNHNAPTFAWCYKRISDFVPDLVANGCNPRVMLDYSGNLFWGFEQMQQRGILSQMGQDNLLDSLKRVTCDIAYHPHVEWLGTMWSHAVAPSTPIPDLKLHIQAWQHHFAAIFGDDNLKRVKGFSPPEMHLPNHPDTLYEYVKALKDCGYRWLMIQEHSIEDLEGKQVPREQKYLPNTLVARNSQGKTIEITALIKTQGSDTKLVAQMQPYHEAKGWYRQTLGGKEVPSVVTQIADGENGGVMMNEYEDAFKNSFYSIRDSQEGVVGLNGTEYLELLEQMGITDKDFPKIQAVGQHKIWQKVDPDKATPKKVEAAIEELKNSDHNFHMDGASWTNDISWVSGYENVLGPMNQLSAAFHKKFDKLVASDPNTTKREDYQQALLYTLALETSCFRYWGQGSWTDFAQSIYDQGKHFCE
jgi:hypothetical protein